MLPNKLNHFISVYTSTVQMYEIYMLHFESRFESSYFLLFNNDICENYALALKTLEYPLEF